MKKFKYRIYKCTDGNGDSHYEAEQVRNWWLNGYLWDWFAERPKRFLSVDKAETACEEHARSLRQKTYTVEIAREFET